MLPRIGITLGDPAGIGSEITAKMLTQDRISDICVPIVIADARSVLQGYEIIGKEPNFEVIHDLSGKLVSGRNYVYDLGNLSPNEYSLGQISAHAGRASGEWIETAVALALAKQIDAIVTNPIHKEAFHAGGYGLKYPGHTEMLAALTGTERYCMMLSSGSLRVCHVTTHVSILDALTKYITPARILEVIRLAEGVAKRLQPDNPLIGVAAINPHGSEQGLFGSEEERLIIPAIQAAASEGIRVEGPVPADTIFSKAKGGWYAVVVAMYHDQGHIPCKFDGFIYDPATNEWTMTGVNVTLGLPIIRTSVDHGTAFDKAGKGQASALSLVQATRMAVELAMGSAP